MRVTVITPSKNQGMYIDQCFRSVHGQTHRDIEHIVLDGLSTDDTAEVAAKYPCIFIQHADNGPAQAINRGLEMATGDIVCWLNADDKFWSCTTLERVVSAFTELEHVDVITGNGYYISEDGRLLTPILVRPERLSIQWLRRFDLFLQPATFWRRNHFRLDERFHYAFDWKLWIEFWQTGLSVLYVPDYFALYRKHALSLTVSDTASRKREIYEIVKNYDRHFAQAAWCWMVWKAYELAESLNSHQLKATTSRVNGWMYKASGGRVASS